jgi:hypothetical protein
MISIKININSTSGCGEWLDRDPRIKQYHVVIRK